MKEKLKTKNGKIVMIVILSCLLVLFVVGIFASIHKSEGVKGKQDPDYMVRVLFEDDTEYIDTVSLDGFVANDQGIVQ